MKKIFSLFTAVLFAGSMLAGVVTLDPATQTPQTSETDINLTIQGIGVAYHGTLNAANDQLTPPAPADFRVFASNTLKLSASSNITKVVIAGKANKAGFTLTTSKGNITTGASYSDVTEKAELSDPLIVVEGINAKSVTLTCGKQLRAYKIEVTLDGEGGGSGDQPGEGGEGGEGEEPDEMIATGTWDFVSNDYAVYDDNTVDFNFYTVEGWYFDDEGNLYGEGAGTVLYVNVPYSDLNDLSGTYSIAETTIDAEYTGAWTFASDDDTEGTTIEFASGTMEVAFNEAHNAYDITYSFKDADGTKYEGTIQNVRLYGDEGGEGGEGGDATDPTNCAEAAQAALSVSANNEEYNGGKVYTIEGYVTKIQTAYNSQYNNVSFWMADTKDGGNVLEAYRAACASEAAAPSVGDKVRVTGKLTKYGTTPEFAAGCTFTIIEKGEGGGGDQPSTEVETITVARALEIGGALEARKSTTETYRIVGYVTVITDDSFDTDYNNMTFWMADTKGSADSNDEGAFYAFRVKPDVKLAVGDKVSVETVIKKYENNDKSILIESGTSGAKATKLTGTAVENSSVAVKSVKRIENAMLIIERNGVIYNVMGQIVR